MDERSRSEAHPTEPLQVPDESARNGGSYQHRAAGTDTDPLPDGGAGGNSGDSAGGPAEAVRAAMEPTNRAKLLLVTAVVSALNLLLLLLLLAVTWTGPEQLTVEGERCIVSEVDGENALFCQR